MICLSLGTPSPPEGPETDTRLQDRTAGQPGNVSACRYAFRHYARGDERHGSWFPRRHGRDRLLPGGPGLRTAGGGPGADMDRGPERAMGAGPGELPRGL